MAGKQLRVLARGSAMVPNHAHFAGVKHDSTVRYIGRAWNASLGDGKTVAGGWVPLKEPTVIEQSDHYAAFTEYVLALRAGDLWAADEETALLAGCKFDPTFGGA